MLRHIAHVWKRYAKDAVHPAKPSVHYKANAPSETRGPCRVQVSLTVSRGKWEQFETLGREFVQVFRDAGLDLKHSMHDAHRGRDPIRVYNYWDLKSDLNRLLHAALTLPEDPDFGVLDGLLQTEIKNVAIPISVPIAPLSNAIPFRYLRIESTLADDDIAEFGARLETSALRLNAKYGWALGEAYYLLTGSDSTVVQIWMLPGPYDGVAPTRAAIAEIVDGEPWSTLLLDRTDELFWPTAYDSQKSVP